MQGRAWVPGLVDGEETFYGVLPLFHAYGMTLCLTFRDEHRRAARPVPHVRSGLVTAAARSTPPTFLPAVPPIYDALARAAAAGTIDLSTVRFAISGAMSLPVRDGEALGRGDRGLLVEGYGMTRARRWHSAIRWGRPVVPAPVGVPFPSTEIRVVDPEDTDVDMPPASAESSSSVGPQVFQGYWGRPGETADALLAGRLAPHRRHRRGLWTTGS